MSCRRTLLLGLAVCLMASALPARAELVQSKPDYTTPAGVTSARMSFIYDRILFSNGQVYNTFAFSPAVTRFIRPDLSLGGELYVDWTTRGARSFSRQAFITTVQWVAPGWDEIRPFIGAGAGISNLGHSEYYPGIDGIGMAGRATVGAYVFMTESVALSPSVTYVYDSRAYRYRYPGLNEFVFFMGIEVFVR